jgi:hypothetical protein
VNGDDVLATRFWWHAHTLRGGLFPWAEGHFGGSYGMREVDDLLHRIAAELYAGHSPETLIRNAALPPGTGPPGTRPARSTGSWSSSCLLRTLRTEPGCASTAVGKVYQNPLCVPCMPNPRRFHLSYSSKKDFGSRKDRRWMARLTR